MFVKLLVGALAGGIVVGTVAVALTSVGAVAALAFGVATLIAVLWILGGDGL